MPLEKASPVLEQREQMKLRSNCTRGEEKSMERAWKGSSSVKHGGGNVMAWHEWLPMAPGH